jgi:hypothetical protein
LRGSSDERSRLCGASFDVYEDKGRAGYEDGGPGIRRLSAVVIILCSILKDCTAIMEIFLGLLKTLFKYSCEELFHLCIIFGKSN